MDEITAMVPPAARISESERALLQLRALPVLLSILTIALGLIYLAVIPPWAGPDEPRHFEYVQLLNLKGRLVSWDDAAARVDTKIIRSMDAVNFWQWGVSEWKPASGKPLPKSFEEIWPQSAHQLHQPPLAYLLYLIPYKLVENADIRSQLYVLRLLSILLDVVVVLAAYVAGRELFPDDPTMALALPVFVMLLPQHLFLHSTVMNDHLVEVALAWMLVLMVRTFRLGLSLPRVLGILVLFAIGLGAKRSALYGVPILAFGFIAYIFSRWGRGRLTNRQRNIRFALTLIVLALAAVAFVWAWNWTIVHQPKLYDYITRLFLFLPTEQFPFELNATLFAPAALRSYAGELRRLFISTWGHFGWMNITLGVQAYWGFAALSVAAFIGLVIYAVRDANKLLSYQRVSLVVFAASVFVALAFIIAISIRVWYLGWEGGAEGRYLFPVLIPLATLFLLGLRAFFPQSKYMLWFGIMIGAMVLYNVIVLVFFVIPFYRA